MSNITKKDAGGLVCVMLDVHIWSGRRLLEKTDLIHANAEFRKLPEKELANLGSVKICDPEDIKKFQAVKGRAERALKRAGLPILGAIGVPESQFEAVHAELVGFQKEFAALEAAFLKSYDDRIAAWKTKHILQNPSWSVLFNSVPTAKHVAGRIGFDFHPYRIEAPADDLKPELNERYNEQVGGLKGALLNEVAAEASKLMQSYLQKDDSNGASEKREYVTQKTLGPLKRAGEKLKSFAFLDPTIGPLAEFVEHHLASLPNVGRIDGPDLLKIWSLSLALASPERAAEIGRRAAEGAPKDVLLGLTVEHRADKGVPPSSEAAVDALAAALAESDERQETEALADEPAFKQGTPAFAEGNLLSWF